MQAPRFYRTTSCSVALQFHSLLVLQSCLSIRTSNFGDIPIIHFTQDSPFRDRPGIKQDRLQIETSIIESHQKAAFLAATSQHIVNWLFAMPISACGLKMDDEAVRVAVGI